VADEGESTSETVLRSKIAERDVQRMIGEQHLGATADFAKAEAGAATFQAFAFAPKIGGNLTLLRADDSGQQTENGYNDSLHVAFFTFAPWRCRITVILFTYSLASASVLIDAKSIPDR
jgi:hypothetical protein